MVIIEAMARGLVVIASDVGATRELIKKNGFLLNAPADLQSAMEKLLMASDIELIQMKNNSLKLVNEKYNLQHMTDSVIQDFKLILNSKII
ncbi:MAG: glycosyltransferase [Crocinitomicaceae bacterium]|nr:glycosyltransferase [Crocinitomicaceae bacterium]